MEQQTRRRKKRGFLDEERAKLELEQLEKEGKIQERLNQQIKEEEEKIREEREQHIRPRRLTEEQRRLRNIIGRRAGLRRAREARAAVDENFRQKQEAREQRGERNRYQRWRARPFRLTDEQILTRSRLSARALNARAREKRHQARPSKAVIAEDSNHQENEEASDKQTTEPIGPLEQGDLLVDGLPGKRAVKPRELH